MTMVFMGNLLMWMLPFYRVEFPVDLMPNDFTYIEYEHGRVVGKQAIKNNDETYIALKKLIVEEKKDWEYDLTTYAPNRLFNSPKMKVNCLNNALVVNYEDRDKEWVQISKKVTKGSCPVVHLEK
jgi:hypothetical protein